MALEFITGYVLGSRNATRAAGMSASAAQFAAQPSTKLHDINDRIDRMTLVIEAMWSLLKEQGLTDEQLNARIEELDGADGSFDGRSTPEPEHCPECGAAVSRGSGHCQFCGREMGEASPFGTV